MLLPLLFSVAHAQQVDTPDLNAQTLETAVAGRWFQLRDAVPSADQAFAFRGTLSYSDTLLEYTDAGGDTQAMMGGTTQLDFGAAYRLDKLRFGLVVPVQILSGTDAAEGGFGLGSIRLDVQRYLMEGPTSLAVGGFVGLPNGGGASAALAAPFSGGLDLALGRELAEGWRAAGVLGVRMAPGVDLEGAEWGHRLRVGAGLMKEQDGMSVALAELTYQPQLAALGQANAELLAGTEFAVGDAGIVLRPALAVGFTDTPGTPQYRALLQIRQERFGPSDRDGDGMLDKDDLCPDEPEDFDTYQDQDGCPEPTPVTVVVVDSDGIMVNEGDWVYADKAVKVGEEAPIPAGAQTISYRDQPNEVNVPTGGPTTITLAIPAPRGPLLVTAVDKSGKTIEGAQWEGSGPIDTGRLPAGTEAQVRPGTYKLVGMAEGYRPAEGTVEVTVDGQATLVLTMLPAKAAVTADRIDIKESVYFETAKDVIKAESHGLLDEVAQLLVLHPEILMVRIEGHTDSRGNANYNRKLSQARADAVMTYLASKGVEKHRLRSIGYGEDKPLDKRNNQAAWTKNRRVDFFVEARAEQK